MKDCPSDPIDVTITNGGIGDAEITDIFVDGNGSSAFLQHMMGLPSPWHKMKASLSVCTFYQRCTWIIS